MNEEKPKTRTEANKPAETAHLREGQKEALDTLADAEHFDGKQREDLTKEAGKKGESGERQR